MADMSHLNNCMHVIIKTKKKQSSDRKKGAKMKADCRGNVVCLLFLEVNLTKNFVFIFWFVFHF